MKNMTDDETETMYLAAVAAVRDLEWWSVEYVWPSGAVVLMAQDLHIHGTTACHALRVVVDGRAWRDVHALNPHRLYGMIQEGLVKSLMRRV